MTMQPYFISLLETLTHKERNYCKELAKNTLPTAVRRYVIALLDSAPEAIKREEEKFLQRYSDSGKRWLRRTAQEFLESALYNLYGTNYELRVLLNQVHLAIARSHAASPFLKPLKRKMQEAIQPINLFFAPLPWIIELAYLALSYPGSTIIDASAVMSFDDALRLVSLDRRRLETVRFAVEHDPFIGENNPYTQGIIQKLQDIQQQLALFEALPFHKSIISLYGMMALIYEELGIIQNSRAIVDQFLSVIPILTDFIGRRTKPPIVKHIKEWLDLTIFLTVVSLQVVNKATGWSDEDIKTLYKNLLRIIALLKADNDIVSTAEIPLLARASSWLATHGYVEEAYQLLNYVGWFSMNPQTALRPIERIDFSVAHFWCKVMGRDWSTALQTVSKLEQIVPQKPIYYYLTELLRFVVALLREDYELLSSTAERVYHWNRRHPNFFPTLGKTLRYIAIKAPKFIYPSDWNYVVSRILQLYKQFPFYLTNVEKYAKLLYVLTQKSNKEEVPVLIDSVNTYKQVYTTPLENIITTLIDHINNGNK